MKKIYILVFALLTTYVCSAYSYLSYYNPRTGSSYGAGTVEDVSIRVKPAGIYFQYELFFSVSAKGSNLTVNDTLEFTYQFDLPPNAAFTDSWLWIGDSAVQAGIYDAGTARNTYEGIVKRRRDPSILFKRSNTQYELKIFPVAGNEKRKIKLTYLLPVQWNKNTVVAPLPKTMFNASQNPLEKLSLEIVYTPEFGYPGNIAGKALDKAGFYTFNQSEIASLENLVFSSPMKNGVYFKSYSHGSENYFQAAVAPAHFIDLNFSRKIVFGFDYDTATTSLKPDELFVLIKEVFDGNLSEKDSVKFIFNSTDGIKWVSENWVVASPVKLEEIVNNVLSHLGKKSSVISLVQEVYSELAEEKDKVNFVLITGGTDLKNPIATGTADSLVKKYKTVPTYFAGIGNRMSAGDGTSGYYYYYSPYTFNYELSILSMKTGGIYFNIGYGYYYYYRTMDVANISGTNLSQFAANLKSIFGYLESNSGSTDIYPVLENGFAYSVQNLNENEQSGISKAIILSGKYSGNMPLTFYLTAEYKSNPYFYKIPVENVSSDDSLIKKFWVASYISRNELNDQGFNNKREEILNASLENRVLSIYTAFLALEAGMEIKECDECPANEFVGNIPFRGFGPVFLDVMPITGVEKKIESETMAEVLAVPNPFTEKTVIAAKGMGAGSKVVVTIYNSLGESVRTIDALTDDSGEVSVTWDGKNESGFEINEGIYQVVLQSAKSKKMSRVVLVR